MGTGGICYKEDKSKDNPYFKAYLNLKSITLNIKNKKINKIRAFLIATKTIPNFTELIKDSKVLESSDENISKCENTLKKSLKQYKLEKRIKIINNYKECKNLIEKEKENEFIIVSDCFLKEMKIDSKDKDEVNIILNDVEKMEIEFPVSKKRLSFKEKSIGFYKFQNNSIKENVSITIKDDNSSILKEEDPKSFHNSLISKTSIIKNKDNNSLIDSQNDSQIDNNIINLDKNSNLNNNDLKNKKCRYNEDKDDFFINIDDETCYISGNQVENKQSNNINNNNLNNNNLNNKKMWIIPNNSPNMNNYENFIGGFNNLKSNQIQNNFFNNNKVINNNFISNNINGNNNMFNNFSQNMNNNQLNYKNDNENNKVINVKLNKKKNREITNIIKMYKNPPLIGLVNIGAVCYMNAPLQCLSNIGPLTNYFLLNKEKFLTIEKYSKEYIISKAYSDVIYNLWDEDKSRKNFSPDYFKEIISKENKMFEGIQANDAKDLVLYLYQTMHKELNEIKELNIFLEMDSDQKNPNIELSKCLYNFQRNNKSIISDLFYFSQANVTKCLTCGVSIYNFSMYNILIFPLEKTRLFKIKKNKPFAFVDIFDCFECNTAEENNMPGNKMYCKSCKNQSDYIISSKIGTLPEIFTIILNRGNNLKFDVEFNISYVLDELGKYIINTNNSEYEKTRYQLISIIIHLGKSGMDGHFFAYCRSPVNRKWYSYNDSIVKELRDPIEEIKGIPYLLFYQKIKE